MAKKYTDIEKKEALQALLLNGKNFEKTARQLGIASNSLRNWSREFPDFFEQSEDKVLDAMVRKSAREGGRFIERVSYAKDRILDRILDIVPEEKFMPNLLDALEVLAKLESEAMGVSNERKTNNLFFQINNQLIENYEQGEDCIEGCETE